MFFQTTPSRLFLLLSLGSVLPWVSPSPIPSLAVSDISHYERRTESGVSVSTVIKREIQVNVDLVISGLGKAEHWSVDVGPTLFQAGTRDPSTMDKFKSKLTTSHYDWDMVKHQLPNPKIIPLGVAKFKDAADQKQALIKVEGIRMKAAAAVKGGNCLDYIKDVLKLLKKEGHITQVVAATYKKEYDANYSRVSKAVWGVDLQP
ncbi:hypothetical protein J3R30DRAFT_3400407 [Lentinula aciculospora]|uniref:Uncharacterized protein n=1 Tax=Lentinula aciculospora TaxID=153920 RepID=A0A9W9APW4_9AGAR|nr:hypothetical protein J3R30DRAFT_3400407 [Lentinula aciculospora]